MSVPLSLDRERAEVELRSGQSGWLGLGLLLMVILGGVTAWASTQQSLWIDELHTAWTASGPWSEVVSRAAIGNQTPLYFAWQWWLGRTFGQSEFVWRATSLLAWSGCLMLLGLKLRSWVAQCRHPVLWCMLGLVALDRHQVFFASEARPYMALCLINCIAWLWLGRWLRVEQLDARAGWTSLAWLACNGLAMWTQPTAVLFIAAQFAYAAWHIFSQCRRTGQRCSTDWHWPVGLAAILVLGLFAWPMRYVLEPAWRGRQAWAAFAADLNWQHVLQQFPLLVIGVPALVAWAVRRWEIAANRAGGGANSAKPAKFDSECLMWFCAWAVPCMLVLLLTATGTAPLMHARYLFAGTIPLVLWSICLLSKVTSRRWVTSLVVLMLLFQVYQQGSLAAWLQGRLPVAVRGEGWRPAVAHLDHAASSLAAHPARANQNRPSDDKPSDDKPSDDRLSEDKPSEVPPMQIYCASNLIEGAREGFLDGRPLAEEYLSLPLRSLYTVGQPVEIIPLLNDPTSWPATIARRAGPKSGRWLIVRSSARGLAKRLQQSGLQPLDQHDFGGVQVVRF